MSNRQGVDLFALFALISTGVVMFSVLKISSWLELSFAITFYVILGIVFVLALSWVCVRFLSDSHDFFKLEIFWPVSLAFSL